ncbi:beta-galactosidase [bacterium]|nr:beta-galactosidase [bacterium]
MVNRMLCAENIGTTFSQVQCGYLGLDWRETYQEVLDMKFDIIRLGAYWNRIEKSRGEFDFGELDWQIKKAREKNIRVLLTVGMKAPRWPEYFIPDWLEKETSLRSGSAVSDKPSVRRGVLIFIREVINRYKDENIIIAWQVENEPLSRSGPKDLWIRKDFLQNEIDLVKELDDMDRPVVVNAMTYANGFLRFLTRFIYRKDPVYETIDIARIPAINVYPAIGHEILKNKVCFWTNSGERIKYLRQFVDYARSEKKSLWVTELQAEPWEPGELVHTREEKAITCGAENFPEYFNELRSLNIGTIFLWGSEYWIFRKKRFHDETWITAAMDIIKEQQQNPLSPGI